MDLSEYNNLPFYNLNNSDERVFKPYEEAEIFVAGGTFTDTKRFFIAGRGIVKGPEEIPVLIFSERPDFKSFHLARFGDIISYHSVNG